MLSLNQPSQIMPKQEKLQVWVFHDAKAGHLSQLEGLTQRLSYHAHCDIHWFNITENKLSLLHVFFLPSVWKQKTSPNVVLGAGHQTHLSVLIAGFIFKAFTTIIMKPSVPRYLFDAVICPQHDKLNDSPKVLSTFGPINKINKRSLSHRKEDKTINLILIGGVSKHYQFDVVDIIEQVKTICSDDPAQQWLMSNSPRTPPEMNEALKQLDLCNLNIHDYRQESLGPIQDILLKTRIAWITPDSMSMIFEALTAQAQVGIINCRPKKNTRIVQEVISLIDGGYITPFEQRAISTPATLNTPWEADRAALWLLEQIANTKPPKNVKAKHHD